MDLVIETQVLPSAISRRYWVSAWTVIGMARFSCGFMHPHVLEHPRVTSHGSLLQREPVGEGDAVGIARAQYTPALLKPDPWVHTECFGIDVRRGLFP
jgi:hypothetical protein